jgi:hypothetical protein
MPAERLQVDRLAGLGIFDQQANVGFRDAAADHCLDVAALLRRRVEGAPGH